MQAFLVLLLKAQTRRGTNQLGFRGQKFAESFWRFTFRALEATATGS